MSKPQSPSTRAGHVAIVGAPNAGKSTLLNALMGERLSIVTAKAQTTRQSVTGIRTDGGAQAVFLDTPGLLDPDNLLQRSMQAAAAKAIEDADLLLVVVDAAKDRVERRGEEMLHALAQADVPKMCVINKIDVADQVAVDAWSRWAAEALQGEAIPVSALRGVGVDALWGWIAARLPPSPYLYDPEDLSTENLRFFVAELVRETALELYRQEIPYGLACAVHEFRETDEPIYIQATVYVERNTQKGIVVGKGGSRIRELGSRSRKKIEAFLGDRVYLDLWVKVLPKWRQQAGALKRLGFAVPEDHGRG